FCWKWIGGSSCEPSQHPLSSKAVPNTMVKLLRAMSAFDLLDRERSRGLQQCQGLLGVEPRVPRFDSDEEPVVRHARELRGVEQRVIELRQPVEPQHAQHGPERAEQDAAFERNRNECRIAVERLCRDDE